MQETFLSEFQKEPNKLVRVKIGWVVIALAIDIWDSVGAQFLWRANWAIYQLKKGFWTLIGDFHMLDCFTEQLNFSNLSWLFSFDWLITPNFGIKKGNLNFSEEYYPILKSFMKLRFVRDENKENCEPNL